MINREIIRTKVVQLVYAYYQNGSFDMAKAEKELLFSLSKTYHLYHYLLDLIVAITREERVRYELACQRAEREGTAKPSARFVDNRFVAQLEENQALQQFVERQKIDWKEHTELVRKLCNIIEQTAVYTDYMFADEDSYEADREVWRKIYKQIIQNNEDLDSLMEDESLYWNDDKEIVDTFVLKTIKRFDPANAAEQPLLEEFKDDSDREYALNLFRAAIMNGEEYQGYMSQMSHNWDLDRLAYMDIVIMQVAIAEMLNFPTVPVLVTISEFVQIAKRYSTSRSGAYINGMLDAIAHNLIGTGRMLKTMA